GEARPWWVAAVRGWLAAERRCSLEPLAGGWLVRAADEPVTRAGTRIVLDLRRPRHRSVEVSGGAGSWVRELSPRHAGLLYLLAVHRAGRSAAALAGDLFGDPARTVTVRAEISRLRRYLGGLLDHRPYRFAENTEVDVLLPDDPLDLPDHLARSAAPARAGSRTCAAGPREHP
ncbi:helix-turn-helix domain-containing protein, partial [Streptomyces pilosus]